LNEVLTEAIWRKVAKRARSAPTRKAAIAYDDLDLRSGDVLIVDASERSIRSGQTDAKLLLKLHDAGVIIFSREGFHSKVALFGKHAIVGSANMSGSDLIEASAITDNPIVASGVAAFIERLSTERNRLDDARIKKLCAIKVTRVGWPRGGKKSNPVRRLGNSTWIVGVKGLKSDPNERLQKRIDRASRHRRGVRLDPVGKKSRFGRECREGDTLIEIFVPYGGVRASVTRHVRVILKDKEPVFNRFYTQTPTRASDEISWSRFQRILKAVGFKGKIRPGSTRKDDSDMAEHIDRKWMRVR
jgi:hypothetical protein